MRLPPPSQSPASFSPRAPAAPPAEVTATPPPLADEPEEEMNTTDEAPADEEVVEEEAEPSTANTEPPPEEVVEEDTPMETVDDEPSQQEEVEESQGGDPPATEPPISESVHATSEYPVSDEEETIEEEIIEEEIITDGEETIEEIIEEEEITEGSARQEDVIPEETPADLSEKPEEEERGMDPPPSPGVVPPPPPTEGPESTADAVSPTVQKKPAVMDNDLAAFMERRRKAAEGGPLDDEHTEQTEPMGNLPPDEPSPEEEIQVAALVPPQEGQEPEEEGPVESEDDRDVLPAAVAGAAAGATAGYYASNNVGEVEHEEEMEPVQEYEGEQEEEIQYDEPMAAAAAVAAVPPQDYQSSAYQPYQSSAYDSPPQSPYQQRSPYQPEPVEDFDEDEEQPRDGKTDRDAPEKASSGPTWTVFGICCCIAIILIAVGIILGIFLSDDDDGDRSLDVTSSPTASPGPGTPTTGPISMEAGRTLTGPSAQGFGAAIAVAQSFLSVGAPIDETGAVFNYEENSGELELISEVPGEKPNSEFGFSMDMNGLNSLIVGAPEDIGDGKPLSTGFAYFYSFTPGTGLWELQGGVISGGGEVSNVAERFGEAVAISGSNLRAAVGAPQHNAGAGRLYVLELVGGTWTKMSEDETSLIGAAASEHGSAVDISDDGNVIAVGSPGNSGFHVYEYQQDTWTRTLEETGPSELGTSVAVLSSTYVVAGAPRSGGNLRGSITLYRKESNAWTEVGSIEGGTGEQLGAKGLVTGRVGPTGNPEVTFVTASGDLRRADFIDGEWEDRFSVDTGISDVSSLAIDKSSSTVKVWVGSSVTGELKEFTEEGAPGPSPGAPTPAPTPAPTLNIPPGSGWVTISGPFTGPIENIGFGSSVTMDGHVMAAGLPEYSEGLGAVQMFQKVGAVWEQTETLFDRDAEAFGEAVDISSGSGRTGLVVGAPQTRDLVNNPNLSFGAAYYLELTGDDWSNVGTPLRPASNTFTASGDFGAAVAVSASTRRIAVGAPNNNLNAATLRNGRVYTYEYDGSDFVPLGAPIDGELAGDLFGSAVAMSDDGTKLLIGGPGPAGASTGSVFYLSWDGSQWQTLLPVIGETDDENLGASVAIIASDGETIAMGGPNFNGGRGVVRVYRRANPQDVFWPQLGPDIVGATPGELLGTTLSGSDGRVVVGTALGAFKVYEYRSTTNSWILVDSATSTGSPVVAIATGSENDVVVGLENEDVEVYGLF